MNTDLDRWDILYWMEGCARGSHLRQSIWERAVNEFYPKLSEEERRMIYMYAKRDLTDIFTPKKLSENHSYQHVGHEDFFQFLACYNPANRYQVHVKGEVNGELQEEHVNAYLYKDDYYIDFRRLCAKEFIVDVSHIELEDRCSLACMWHRNCARYDKDFDDRIGYSVNSPCDWFINKDTGHGADLTHFE